MSFGDAVLDLMGQVDPRRRLAESINNSMNPAQPGAPVDPNAMPTMAQGGTGPDQPNQPQQQQPQAYQSPSDIGQMLFDLQRRQSSVESINRGLGLLLGGFARPEDRPGMISAMEGQSGGGPGGGGVSTVDDIVKLQGLMFTRQQLMIQYRNAPLYAKQLNIPIEQVYAYINAGKMPEIMAEVQKQRLIEQDPAHIAATEASKAETSTKNALLGGVAAKQQADIEQEKASATASLATAGKTQAEIPFVAPKTQSEIDQAKATTAEAQARTPTIAPAAAAALAKSGADTELAKQQADKLAYEAQVRANLANAAKDPNFAATHGGLTQEMVQTLPFEEITKILATPAQIATKTAATDQATARTELNKGSDNLVTTIKLIDEVSKDPNLQYRTGVWGLSGSMVPPGMAVTALQAKLDQLKGLTKVGGLGEIKGGLGRVLLPEFSAATEAQSTLGDQHQSLGDYQKALAVYRAKVVNLLQRGYQKAEVAIPDDINSVLSASSLPPQRDWKRNPKTNKLELK
jgi:uncharacterized protein (UPF0147 family)